MANNITKLYPSNAAKNPDNVMEQAMGEYESIFIVGFDKDGCMDSRASTNITQSGILWLIERFKHKLLNGDYDD